jgi:DNA (cytosine-5)-methyltransferase 1
MTVIPFIDIFAGPGGLSEGFSRFQGFAGGGTGFESRLAIEKDATAARTLELRSFFRMFAGRSVPNDYYDVIRGQRAPDGLALYGEWAKAKQHVWQAELGAVSESDLHNRIAAALGDQENWVLLGGPPCQAYSLMGRARMTGIGAKARISGADLEELRRLKKVEFARDHRHVLYREYLRIVAVHQPAVFVMENVKGILSARLRTEDDQVGARVFEHIRRDLSDPWEALSGDSEYTLLQRFRRGKPHQYHLYSLVAEGGRTGAGLDDREFLIPSEEYGIPQRRHRVILLGVRSDLAAKPEALKPSNVRTVSDAIEPLPKLRSTISRSTADWSAWVDAIRLEFRRMGLTFPTDRKARNSLYAFFTKAGEPLPRGAEFTRAELIADGSRLAEWYSDDQLKGVIQHVARSHMISDLVRYLYASVMAEARGRSPTLEEWPCELLPDHRNVTIDEVSGQPRAEGFSDRFKVQVWGQPSSTVTSHIAKDGHYFIHPDPMQCRSLTVREAARLQTFPDNYYFCGNRTQQYHQVGNAVPPYLACQIAGVVAKVVEDAGLAGDLNG